MLMSDAGARSSPTFFNPVQPQQSQRPAGPPSSTPSGPLTGHPTSRVALPAGTAPASTSPATGPLTGHPTSRTLPTAATPTTISTPTSQATTTAGNTPTAPTGSDQPSTSELVIDGSQLVLDVTGLVDPTPISDGGNALISLFRGDFKDAAISAAAILPAGDLLKAGRITERFTSLIAKAANSPAARAVLEPIVGKIGDLLGKVPVDSLPAPVRSMVESLKGKIDNYTSTPAPTVGTSTVSPPASSSSPTSSTTSTPPTSSAPASGSTNASTTLPAGSTGQGTPLGRAAAAGEAHQPRLATQMVPRPHWRHTENNATRLPNANPQQSFLNGQPVSGNPRGSTRPDQHVPGTSGGPGFSIDAKNYRLSSPSDHSRLVRDVARQAQTRQPHLPAGDMQKVTIDLRGQAVTPAQAQLLKTRIESQSGGLILARHVTFLW